MLTNSGYINHSFHGSQNPRQFGLEQCSHFGHFPVRNRSFTRPLESFQFMVLSQTVNDVFIQKTAVLQKTVKPSPKSTGLAIANVDKATISPLENLSGLYDVKRRTWLG